MKGCATRLQQVCRDTHLHHGVPVHDVDDAPIVDENSGEPHINSGNDECWIHHQSINSRVRHDPGIILPSPADLMLGLMHIFRHS